MYDSETERYVFDAVDLGSDGTQFPCGTYSSDWGGVRGAEYEQELRWDQPEGVMSARIYWKRNGFFSWEFRICDTKGQGDLHNHRPSHDDVLDFLVRCCSGLYVDETDFS